MNRKYIFALAVTGLLFNGISASAEELSFQDALSTITVEEDTKIYEEASTDSKGVAYVMAGDSVQQIGIADGWSKIVYQDQICYMPLESTKGTETAVEAKDSEAAIAVTEEGSEQNTEETEAEADSEAATEAVTEAQSAEAEATDSLSDDIYSFQFLFNGKAFQLPERYTDFVEKGWIYLNEPGTIDASTYTYDMENFICGNSKISANIVNFDWNPASVEDCYISSVKFSLDVMDPADEIMLPGGLKVDKELTEDKVREQYGEPTDVNESEYSTTCYYSKGSYEGVTFRFPKNEDHPISVEIENMVQPEDFEATEMSNETPDVVALYKEPSELSEDLWDYTVEFDEALYTLPCPVTELEKNGWNIAGDVESVSGGDWGYVEMTKDNQNVRFSIRNYAETATSAENCFVYKLRGEQDGKKLKIAKDIQQGMSEEELLKALDGVTYEIYEDGDYKSYNIKNPGASSSVEYSIIIIEGKVKTIEVEHMPNTSEMKAFYAAR